MINTTNLLHGTKEEIWNTLFKDKEFAKDYESAKKGQIVSRFGDTTIEDQLEAIESIPGKIGRVCYLETLESTPGERKMKIQNQWVHLL